MTKVLGAREEVLSETPTRSGARRIRLGALVLGLFAVAFAAFLSTRSSSPSTSSYSPLLYKMAPSLSGPTLSGGRTSLASMRGKFVVVNFFASWCTACRQEEPQLRNFLKNEGSKVAVLGVDYDDNPASARTFLATYGATWSVISDTQGQRALRWGVDQPPESYLISPKGKVLTKILGAINDKQLTELVHIAQAKGY